jgi:hypothetical protein
VSVRSVVSKSSLCVCVCGVACMTCGPACMSGVCVCCVCIARACGVYVCGMHVVYVCEW